MTLVDLLIEDEGLKLKVYDDATGRPIGPGDKLIGNPTIGVGRCLNKNGISQTEALALLDNDLARITNQAASSFSWFGRLSLNRQNVILSMIFNMGMGGFVEFKDMIESIKHDDFESAAAEMLDSKWARNQVRDRAHRLSKMLREG